MSALTPTDSSQIAMTVIRANEILPTNILFLTIFKVYSFFRSFRRAKNRLDPNNFSAVLAGYSLEFFAERSVLVYLAANCVVIANRLFQCREEKKLLLQSTRELRDACSWNRVYHQPIIRESDDNVILSPSTINSLRSSLHSMGERVSSFFMSNLRIIKHSFLLSANVLDAMDAFYTTVTLRPDPENVRDFFINQKNVTVDNCVDALEGLIDSLNENQEVIDPFLKSMKVSWTTKHLVEKLNSTTKVAVKLGKVWNVAGKSIHQFLKESLNQTYQFSSKTHIKERREAANLGNIV